MNSFLTKEELLKLTQELVDYGEDKGELSMWYGIYDLMADDEKTSLCSNLQSELEALKKLS